MKDTIHLRRNFKSQTSVNHTNGLNLKNGDIKSKLYGFINPKHFRHGDGFLKKEKTEVSFSESVYFLDDHKKTTERKILNDIRLPHAVKGAPKQINDFYEKKIEKTLDVPRFKMKNNPGKRLTTTEKTSPNKYVLYFKKENCERDSCKIKLAEKLKALNGDYKNSKSNKEQQNAIDLKIRDLLSHSDANSTVSNASIFKKTTHQLKQNELDWYKNEQDSMNKKNFLVPEKPKTPPPENAPKPDTRNNYFYDFDVRTPTPVISVQAKKRGVRLTLAQLRTLSISEKFLRDAKDMIFIPETNSFEYKKRSIFD